MKTASITILAIIAAVQILLFGLLALAYNSAVFGFMCGVCIPETVHLLRENKLSEENL